MIKKFCQQLIFLFILFLSNLVGTEVFALSQIKNSSKSLDGIVAIVNDSIITQSQLTLAIERSKKQLAEMGNNSMSEAEIVKHSLNQLIGQQLILQVAKQQNITASEKDVDQAVNRLLMTNHTTMDQLKAHLASDKISYKQFRQDIANQIIGSKMQAQVIRGKANLTEKDIEKIKQKIALSEKRFSQYHIADFGFLFDDSYSQAQKKKLYLQASNLVTQLNKGANIDKVSIAYEDLGYRFLPQLPDIYVKPLLNLSANQLVTAPILAPNGYHVLKIVEIKTPPDKLTNDQIKRMAFDNKVDEQVNKWVKTLKKTAYIKIMD